jgi:quinol monooxygenase YgiN
MLIRIVKLTFQPDKVEEFKELFKEERKTIAAFDGCSKVELWGDTGSENVFFTYSEWRDKSALENYRNSDFFKTTWKRAKTFFADKAVAWSLMKI